MSRRWQYRWQWRQAMGQKLVSHWVLWVTLNTQRGAHPAQKAGVTTLMSSPVWVLRKLTNYPKREHKSLGHSAGHTGISVYTYPDSSISWDLSPMLENALHSAMQWSQYGQAQHNSKYSAYFWKWGAPVSPKSALPRNWKEEAALSSPLTLTWSSDMHISKNCSAFSVFLPLSKRGKKNTAFQVGSHKKDF